MQARLRVCAVCLPSEVLKCASCLRPYVPAQNDCRDSSIWSQCQRSGHIPNTRFFTQNISHQYQFMIALWQHLSDSRISPTQNKRNAHTRWAVLETLPTDHLCIPQSNDVQIKVMRSERNLRPMWQLQIDLLDSLRQPRHQVPLKIKEYLPHLHSKQKSTDGDDQERYRANCRCDQRSNPCCHYGCTGALDMRRNFSQSLTAWTTNHKRLSDIRVTLLQYASDTIFRNECTMIQLDNVQKILMCKGYLHKWSYTDIWLAWNL